MEDAASVFVGETGADDEMGPALNFLFSRAEALMGRVEHGLFKWTCHRVFPKLMEKAACWKIGEGEKLELGSEAFTHNNKG